MYQAEAQDPRDDYSAHSVPADIAEFLSPFSQAYDARRSLGLFAPLSDVSAIEQPEDEEPAWRPHGGLGFTIPIIGVESGDVVDAVDFVGDLFGGGGPSKDPASAVWGNVKPSDVLTLATLRVVVKPDGWFDAASDQKISSVDADYRAGALMAQLIGAQMPAPKSAWLDLATGQPLSNTEAWNRWVSRYGATATLESVLRQAGVTLDAMGDAAGTSFPVAYPPTQAPVSTYPVTYPAPTFGTPKPGYPPTGYPTTAGTAPRPTATAGLSSNMMLLAGAGLAVAFVASRAGKRSAA